MMSFPALYNMVSTKVKYKLSETHGVWYDTIDIVIPAVQPRPFSKNLFNFRYIHDLNEKVMLKNNLPEALPRGFSSLVVLKFLVRFS